MNRQILITSFTVWKPHHISNASDDLLVRFMALHKDAYRYLRLLPVDFSLAAKHVIEAVDAYRPRFVVCCGMAENRSRLAVESRASLDGKAMRIDIDPVALTERLPMTEVSHDCGDFVCNTLFYRCMEHVRLLEGVHHCLFIHVPVLTDANAQALLDDFTEIIKRLEAL